MGHGVGPGVRHRPQRAIRTVIDAEGETLLRATDDGRAVVEGPGRVLTITLDSFAALSPDGTQVVAESDDEGVLLDTTTGEPVVLDTGYDWALPFQWIDGDTVAVLAYTGTDTDAQDRPYVLACTVSTGACGTAQALPAGFQLPIGIHFGR